jgi:hypothetical protein
MALAFKGVEEVFDDGPAVELELVGGEEDLGLEGNGEIVETEGLLVIWDGKIEEVGRLGHVLEKGILGKKRIRKE